jgi:hypothetical protein
MIRERRVLLLLALSMSLPLFFVASGGIGLAPPYSTGVTGTLIFPFSYILIPLYLPVATIFTGKLHFDSRVYVLGFLLLGCYLFGFLWGTITGRTIGSEYRSTLRFLQSSFPVVSLFLGASVIAKIVDRIEQAEELSIFIKTFAGLTGLFLFLYIGQTFLTGPSSRFALIADHIGPFNNPKIKRFYPTLLAISSVYFVARYCFEFSSGQTARAAPLIFGLILLAGTLTFWSRSALVTLFIGLIWILRFLPNARWIFLAAVYGILLTTALIYWALNSELESLTAVQRSLTTATNLFASSVGENSGDTVRFSRIQFAADQSLATIFGSGFETHQQFLFPIEDIAVAENGFLDVAVRGGLPALAILTYLIFAGYHRISRCAQSGSAGQKATCCVYIGLMVGALPWLHLATESYFSMLFWFILGASNTVRR